MSKKTIEVRNANRKSTKMVVPVDGEIELNEDGVVELSEECAKLLVENGKGWRYLTGVLTDEEIAEVLSELELSDLKKLAIQNKLNKHEVGKDKWVEESKEKDSLIAYIVLYSNEELKTMISETFQA